MARLPTHSVAAVARAHVARVSQLMTVPRYGRPGYEPAGWFRLWTVRQVYAGLKLRGVG